MIFAFILSSSPRYVTCHRASSNIPQSQQPTTSPVEIHQPRSDSSDPPQTLRRTMHPSQHLTVRFLVSGSGTWTTEFLGFASSVIGNQQCSVVLYKRTLQLVLAELIDVLLVVGDNGLGDSLTDSVDLGSVTTTSNSDSDVDTGELIDS